MKNKLHFMCGKMASGKSTLSKKLADENNALLLSEDELLIKGNNVVLDFPANTTLQRQWFKDIFEKANVEHILHYVNRSDEVCKKQLKKRNENISKDAPLIDETTFDSITKYFQEPELVENFNMKVY